MGVSAPFVVKGLSVKILNHTFPPFFKYRIMALLAASSSFAETHFVSKHFNPKLPKASSVPRTSLPFDVPLFHFLCFTRFGVNISLKFFSLKYPNLHPYGP